MQHFADDTLEKKHYLVTFVGFFLEKGQVKRICKLHVVTFCVFQFIPEVVLYFLFSLQ